MKRADYIAIAACALLIVVLGIFLARSGAPGRIMRLRSRVDQTAKQLTTEPDTVYASAVDQRYRLRHEALAGLRTDLAHLVTAESAFLADSGHPAVNLPLSYGFSVDPGTAVSVRIRIDGWDATVQSMYTPIRCSVGVDIPDGSRIQLPKPIDCVGEHETRP